MGITKEDLKCMCSTSAYNEKQSNELFELYEPCIEGYPICCTGDVCNGDEVAFAEAVFTGSYRKPKFSHFELIQGKVVNDSYGSAKQQHTFTIELENGTKIRRKGRNVYRYITLRKNRNETERNAALEDKHERGEAARRDREARREAEWSEKPSW